MTVKIKTEGQTIELPDYLTVDDQTLRDVLLEAIPWIPEAEIKRQPDGTIELVKRAGPKADFSDVIAALDNAPRQVNPAAQLLHDLHEQGITAPEGLTVLRKTILEALEKGYREIKLVQQIVARLDAASSQPASHVPTGV